MSEKDNGNLYAILDSCEKITRFSSKIDNADALFNEEKTFDAVLMNFIIIGESVGRLSEDFKLFNNHIPW